MTMTYLVMLPLIGWFIIFMVTELKCAQRGKTTWGWIEWIYNNVEWCKRVRW